MKYDTILRKARLLAAYDMATDIHTAHSILIGAVNKELISKTRIVLYANTVP